MPSSFLRAARDFLDWYAGSLSGLEEGARQLEDYLHRLLISENLQLHVVTGRAKSPESVRAKLLRKQYANPRASLTDRIGARVIVYRASEVDRVAELLRHAIHIRERDSTDKRRSLGLREFGYRSYHLVGSLPPRMTARPELRALRGQVFEIQIRSLLEHAWAEIEHNLVYKSGAEFPVDLKRRFAAIAGVLELLEHEFNLLRQEALHLTEVALASVASSATRRQVLDVPRMLALLEFRWPHGPSFRQAEATGQPFPPGIGYRFLLALSIAGIRDVGALNRVLTSPSLRTLRDRYATAQGISSEEVSHLATLALIIGYRAPGLLEVYFPEFTSDLSLVAALKRGGGRQRRARARGRRQGAARERD